VSELKVLVNDSFAFASDQVAVAIVLHHNHEERSIMRVNREGFTTWEPVEPMAGTTPTITLSNDAGRALLEALLRHYQGAEDMHTVRADLLHERERVDKLITLTSELSHKAIDLADTAVSQ
jgi:hypothetical protein